MSAPVLCTLYRIGMGEAGVLARRQMTEEERRERIASLERMGHRDVLWVPAGTLKIILRAHDEDF